MRLARVQLRIKDCEQRGSARRVMLRDGGSSSSRRVARFRSRQRRAAAITRSSAGACHRAGHFGPDPLADDDNQATFSPTKSVSSLRVISGANQMKSGASIRK